MNVKRKVIRQGRSTLTISIPASLVQKFGIDAGDEIDIEEREGELVINPQRASRRISVELDVSDFSETLFWRCTNALYVRGIDEMVLSFRDGSQLAWIRELPNRLVGFEITKEGNNTCVVGEVSEIKKVEFETMLRQLFFTLKIMSRDTLNGLRNNSVELLDSIKHRETDLNRIVRFCLRILNKAGYMESAKTIPIYDIIIYLENIGDSLTDMVEEINPKNKINKDCLEALQEIDKLIEGFYFSFFKNDFEKVKELYKKNKQVKELMKEIKPKTKEEILVVNELGKITDLISEAIESELIVLI